MGLYPNYLGYILRACYALYLLDLLYAWSGTCTRTIERTFSPNYLLTICSGTMKLSDDTFQSIFIVSLVVLGIMLVIMFSMPMLLTFKIILLL